MKHISSIFVLCIATLFLNLTACDGSNPESTPCASLTLDGLINAAGVSLRDLPITNIEEYFPIVCPIADVSAMRTFGLEDLGGPNLTFAEYDATLDRLVGYRRATLAELLVWAKEAWDGSGDILGCNSSRMVSDDGIRLIPLIVGIGGEGGQRVLAVDYDRPENHWDGTVGVKAFLVVRE
jgi:hypothetical protein